MADLKPSRSGHQWLIAEERFLYDNFADFSGIDSLADSLRRTSRGVTSRLVMLGLLEGEGVDERVVTPKPAFRPCAKFGDSVDFPLKDDVPPTLPRSRARRERPPMASLNVSEQHCVQLFRLIPKNRRTAAFLVMRALAALSPTADPDESVGELEDGGGGIG